MEDKVIKKVDIILSGSKVTISLVSAQTETWDSFGQWERLELEIFERCDATHSTKLSIWTLESGDINKLIAGLNVLSTAHAKVNLLRNNIERKKKTEI